MKNKLFSTIRLRVLGSFMVLLAVGLSARAQTLSAADVQTVIAQAVSTAVSLNQKVTVSVTDKEGICSALSS